jgi:ureidoglycolate hydrolase
MKQSFGDVIMTAQKLSGFINKGDVPVFFDIFRKGV